jgi:hypothetical protein
MRWGYGGRRRSCDGEERGGGELDAPRMTNSERRARATLTVDESRDGGDGRTGMRFGHGRECGFGQRWRRGRDGARRGGSDSRSERGRSKRRGADGTPARGPNSAFVVHARHGTWQPCGNGVLLGRPGADSGV